MFNHSCKNCANRKICQYCDQPEYKCDNWIGEMELQTLRAPEFNIKRALMLKPEDFENGVDSVAMQLISGTANHALDILAKYIHGYPAYERPIVIAAMQYIANERYAVFSDEEKAFADMVAEGFQTIRFDFSGLNKQ